jgi:hypothetical protein
VVCRVWEKDGGEAARAYELTWISGQGFDMLFCCITGT